MDKNLWCLLEKKTKELKNKDTEKYLQVQFELQLYKIKKTYLHNKLLLSPFSFTYHYPRPSPQANTGIYFLSWDIFLILILFNFLRYIPDLDIMYLEIYSYPDII